MGEKKKKKKNRHNVDCYNCYNKTSIYIYKRLRVTKKSSSMDQVIVINARS